MKKSHMDVLEDVLRDDAKHVPYKREIVREYDFLYNLFVSSSTSNREPMRLWSLHPKYLDTRWLVALWREALLAKHVLEGKTKGYIHHPQLTRFRDSANPQNAINYYISVIYEEAQRRRYHFDSTKVAAHIPGSTLSVTSGQVDFEVSHLRSKLMHRDRKKYEALEDMTDFLPHPLFVLREWDREAWEKSANLRKET